jgi:hypothetical protein
MKRNAAPAKAIKKAKKSTMPKAFPRRGPPVFAGPAKVLVTPVSLRPASA